MKLLKQDTYKVWLQDFFSCVLADLKPMQLIFAVFFGHKSKINQIF